MSELKCGTWKELQSAVDICDGAHSLALWWREPAPNVCLPEPLLTQGQGKPVDFDKWPEPLECWFWFGRSDGSQRHALHALRQEVRQQGGWGWQWLELTEPSPRPDDTKVWTLSKKGDLHRFGVSLGDGLRSDQPLIRSADAGMGWFWLGVETGDE